MVRANFNLDAELPAGATLLIGGTHGDERATVLLLESFNEVVFGSGEHSGPVAVLAVANPDGYERDTRYNARGIDINRNFGFNWHAETADPPGPAAWSEPETCSLRDFILAMEPAKIVSLHWALAEIDADGEQSNGLAQAMWDALCETERRPYRVRFFKLGFGKRRLQETYEVCPGSLGQWCGYGLRYANGTAPAMITLELPYDPSAESRPSPLPAGHLASLHNRWREDAAGYLTEVESGVHKMLLAACRFSTMPETAKEGAPAVGG